MKKLTSIIILSFISITITSSGEKVVENSELNFRKNLNSKFTGKYYLINSDIPYSGKVVSYHENGQIKKSETYKNGNPHGPYKSYYENGQLWQSGNKDKRGRIHGSYKRYYENGQLECSVNIKNFKKVGLSEIYYENGQLKSSCNYKDGELDGLFERYDKNGQLKSSQNYKDGKLVD